MILFPHCRMENPAWDFQLSSDAGEARVAYFSNDARAVVYWRAADESSFATALCDSRSKAMLAAEYWVAEVRAPQPDEDNDARALAFCELV